MDCVMQKQEFGPPSSANTKPITNAQPQPSATSERPKKSLIRARETVKRQSKLDMKRYMVAVRQIQAANVLGHTGLIPGTELGLC